MVCLLYKARKMEAMEAELLRRKHENQRRRRIDQVRDRHTTGEEHELIGPTLRRWSER